MTEHFNKLTEAQAERLALLAEEAAEVIQVIGKILRHGYESTHPDDPEGDNNRQLLENEIGDLQFAIGLVTHHDIDIKRVFYATRDKAMRVGAFLHHQERKK